VTDPNIATLDDQVYIIFHKQKKIRRSLVVQFESSAGNPVSLEFHGNALVVHVRKNEKTTVWRKAAAGVIVDVRRDYVERLKYGFMDVHGKPVKH